MKKNQSFFLKIACIVLCLLLTVPMFAGCKTDEKKTPNDTDAGGETQGKTEVTTAGEIDTTPENEKDELKEKYDFDRNFIILCRESTDYEFKSASAITGDIVSDAVFSRNAAVEDRAGVTINVVPMNGDWQGKDKLGLDRGGNKEFEARVRTNAMENESYFDLIATHSAYLANLAVEGLGADLNSFENIDLTKRWWNEAYYDDCNYNGAIYMMVGDLAYTLYEYMEVIFFNEDMVKSLGINDAIESAGYGEDLYDLVNEGEWTWEKLQEYAALIEVNPDAADDTRVYGLMVNAHSERSIQNAFEAEFLVKDDDGKYYYPESIGDQTLTRLNSFVDYVRNNRGATVLETANNWGDETGTQTPVFVANRSLFYTQMLGEAVTLKADMEANFGVLPFPKWNSEQLEYHISTKDSLTGIMIPKNVADRNSTGVVTELLALYGYQDIVPAYYEKVLKKQSFNNYKCTDMLEMIRTSANISFQTVFTNLLNASNSMVPAVIKNSSYTLTSYYEQKRSTWNTEQLYADLDKIAQESAQQ